MFKPLRVVSVKINNLLSSLFGLRIVELKNYRYRTRNHPYHRIENIIKKLFKGEDLTILDVGSNKGHIIDFFSTLPNIKNIIGLEPNPDLFDFLNKKYKGSDIIKIYSYALSDKIGTLDLCITEDDRYSSFIEPSKINNGFSTKSKLPVEVLSGDEFCAKHHNKDIHVLSLNIQGFENYALKGFSDCLKNRKIKSIIIEIDFSQRYKRNSFYNVESILNQYEFYLFDINLIKTDYSTGEKFPVGIELADCFYVLKEYS